MKFHLYKLHSTKNVADRVIGLWQTMSRPLQMTTESFSHSRLISPYCSATLWFGTTCYKYTMVNDG